MSQSPNSLRDAARPEADMLPSIGDNNPPLISNDELYLQHTAVIARVSELEAKAAEQPTFVELGDDRTQGALQDIIKEVDGEIKRLESKREEVKDPFLSAGRLVDGFFKALADPKGKQQGRLDKIRAALAKTATDYLRRKDAAERARLEAEARKRREEEDRLRAEQRKREEEAERLREKHRPTAATEKAIVASTIGHQADAAMAATIEAEQAANAKPAELARTRSDDGGSLGTLNEIWKFEVTSFDDLEPDAIWSFIPRADKEKAIAAYMRINAPKEKTATPWAPLRGVNFFRTTRGQFR